MRHRVATFKINRSAAHVRSLLAKAVCSLIEHNPSRTTLVRAKRIRQQDEDGRRRQNRAASDSKRQIRQTGNAVRRQNKNQD